MIEQLSPEQLIAEKNKREYQKKRLAARKAYYDDHRMFCKNILDYPRFDNPVYESTFLDPFYDDLFEHLAANRDWNDIFMVSRGHLKTTILTIGYALTEALNNPECRILIVSRNDDAVEEIMFAIKGHFEGNEPLRRVWAGDSENDPLWSDPKKESPIWRNTAVMLRRKSNHREATITCASILAPPVGGHYDKIIFDDIVDDKNSATQEQREKVTKNMKMFRPMLNPGGCQRWVGTRYDFRDAYRDVIAARPEGKVFIRNCWKDETCTEPALSSLFSKKELDEIQNEMGPFLFSAQYLLDPVGADNAPFLREWLQDIYIDLNDSAIRPKFRSIIMAVDPSLNKKGGDNTGVAIAATDGPNLYVLHATPMDFRPEEIPAEVIKMAIAYGVEQVLVETEGNFELMFRHFEEEVGRQQATCIVTPVKAGRTNTKERKILAMAGYYQSGRVRHNKHLEESLFESEMLSYPRGADDVLDALQYCFNALVYLMDTPSETRKIEAKKAGDYSPLPPAPNMVQLLDEQFEKSLDRVFDEDESPMYAGGFL